jgi:hypothetical protein
MSDKPLLITPAKAAEILGLDQVAKHPDQVVRRLAREGRIVGRRVGKYLMIDRESVEHYAKMSNC